jgi:very-short-patch-repair endonuclease
MAVLASRQHGVVAGRQLLELGFTREGIRRRVEAGRLGRLHRGVFAVGHWALTPKSRDLAAVLACGPRALLSHRSAGVRHGLLNSSGQVEVSTPRGCKPKPGIRVHAVRTIHPDDRAEVDGIPVTSVARTIVDLAGALDDRRLTAVVNEAEVRRVFDLTEVEAAIERAAGRAGPKRLRRVLTNYAEPPGYSVTKAEALFQSLCNQNELPRPQRVVVGPYELDFYWADARLAVEVDGRAVHATRRAFQADRERDRKLAALGIQVARVTWRDITVHRGRLVAELEEIRRERLP